ncbi:MAG: 4,5:9,10-diseco-3-hydroxy-5,9,17-trioxoandrosta-1(10),2-diene-4-oate hydrolase [Gammaproteobacteria bacterium]|nr:4,5:9,10-diseco-3-hydroxy-5,9,17-trioxoandrosta-1(10),2-diene-4-oate hydrolase [Gammaproteobacteria bacterium]
MIITVDKRKTYTYTGSRKFDPRLETIVFVHGGGLDHTVWLLQSRYFAHHGRNVLAVDLPGHGRTEGPLIDTIPGMADWLFSLVDALEIPKVILVGHSMGSLVTLEAAARYADRTRRLALLGSAAPMAVADSLLNAARDNRHMGFDMINIWGHSAQAQIGGSETPGMWMTGSAIRLLERAGTDVLFNDLNACNEYGQGMDSAARITCATLLLAGRTDIMTPINVARDLVQTIPDARLEVLDCGHLLMDEKPNEVLDELIAFIGPPAEI